MKMSDASYHFPPLGEFKFIEQILSQGLPLREATPKKRFWFGAGDDCAAFDGWLVTKDMSVEKTHFRLDWATPEEAVEKCIVSNVSDISSMGGTPAIALLGICHNKGWDKLTRDRIAMAFAQGFRKRGIALVGGDTVAGEVGLFSITLLGKTEGSPLRRSGAKPGDSVYVSGPVGASAAGLWAFLNGYEKDPLLKEAVKYHLAPIINESAGAELVEMGVCGGCIDLSDGLSSELNHLALSSRVKIRVEEKLIPLDPSACYVAEHYGVSPREFSLKGGEDYRLLFTTSLPDSIFYGHKKGGSQVTRIGTVIEGSGVELVNLSGNLEFIKAESWSHL